MKKRITISLLIGYLISKLTYFSYTMRIIDEKEIKILRNIDNYLNKYIYLNNWKAVDFINIDNIYFVNHIFNYTITYSLIVFFVLFLFKHMIFFKSTSFKNKFSKDFEIVDGKFVKLNEYGIYVNLKNIVNYKNFKKKITFGPYKGSKWYDLNEDYIIWLYNSNNKKYRPEVEKCLFNFSLKINNLS